MFNLTRQKLGNATVLHCSGRIVFPDADRLRKAVLQIPRTPRLVLDLANVMMVDAAGLGALVALYHWAKSASTEFKLMNVGSKLQFLLELTRLNTVLQSCSVQDMLEFLCCSSDDSEGSWWAGVAPLTLPAPKVGSSRIAG